MCTCVSIYIDIDKPDLKSISLRKKINFYPFLCLTYSAIDSFQGIVHLCLFVLQFFQVFGKCFLHLIALDLSGFKYFWEMHMEMSLWRSTHLGQSLRDPIHSFALLIPRHIAFVSQSSLFGSMKGHQTQQTSGIFRAEFSCENYCCSLDPTTLSFLPWKSRINYTNL